MAIKPAYLYLDGNINVNSVFFSINELKYLPIRCINCQTAYTIRLDIKNSITILSVNFHGLRNGSSKINCNLICLK